MMQRPRVAVASAERPTWQDVIDALMRTKHYAEAAYMEELRAAAKDPSVTTEELAAMLLPLGARRP